jgi:DAACS family dicarboxylate/amino acid:cation (Na+ or H+) symporter
MIGQKRGIPLHTQMLIGFVVGLAAGLAANALSGADAPWVVALTTYVTQPIGQIFLRLLFMLVIPLLFSALVVGVSEMGDIGTLGRAGWRTLALTVLFSSLAVVIGLIVVNVLRPGDGIDPATAQRLLAGGAGGAKGILETAGEAPAGADAFVQLIPSNVFTAAAENQVLPVMVFALIFGIGVVMSRGAPQVATLKTALEGVFEVVMTLINLVIRFAPIAVACLIFNLAALFGWDLLVRLGAYVGVVLLALAIHMFVVYPIALATLGARSPIGFFRDIQEAIIVAFSTSSSNAALPTALRVADQNLRLPRRIARFVLTIGATANQNGTALFEGVTVLFLAQLFGVELSLAQQVTVMFVCILAGIGTAGVPSGSLPVIAIILGMVGLPPEAIGLVLGVDRILDMSRTTVNVTGDLAIAAIVSRGEPEDAPTSAAVAPNPGLRDAR